MFGVCRITSSTLDRDGSADDGKRFSSDGRCVPIASRREDLREGVQGEGRARDDGKRLWCWTLFNHAPAGTEEMLLKKMKIYMDKGEGPGGGMATGSERGSRAGG